MVDEKDTVYINDIESNEIKMYDIAGKFITRCGNISVNGIPLNHPHSSEFGADANFSLHIKIIEEYLSSQTMGPLSIRGETILTMV